jgi:hypothetical protein
VPPHGREGKVAVKFTAEDFSEQLDHNVISMTISGKLDVEDYDSFAPELEKFIKEHENVRMLIQLEDFKGWTAGALWEDSKFGIRNFNGIERIAIVGDKSWENGMVVFARVFTKADIRCFDSGDLQAGLKWVTED